MVTRQRALRFPPPSKLRLRMMGHTFSRRSFWQDSAITRWPAKSFAQKSTISQRTDIPSRSLRWQLWMPRFLRSRSVWHRSPPRSRQTRKRRCSSGGFCTRQPRPSTSEDHTRYRQVWESRLLTRELRAQGTQNSQWRTCWNLVFWPQREIFQMCIWRWPTSSRQCPQLQARWFKRAWKIAWTEPKILSLDWGNGARAVLAVGKYAPATLAGNRAAHAAATQAATNRSIPLPSLAGRDAPEIPTAGGPGFVTKTLETLGAAFYTASRYIPVVGAVKYGWKTVRWAAAYPFNNYPNASLLLVVWALWVMATAPPSPASTGRPPTAEQQRDLATSLAREGCDCKACAALSPAALPLPPLRRLLPCKPFTPRSPPPPCRSATTFPLPRNLCRMLQSFGPRTTSLRQGCLDKPTASSSSSQQS